MQERIFRAREDGWIQEMLLRARENAWLQERFF